MKGEFGKGESELKLRQPTSIKEVCGTELTEVFIK